MIGSVGTGCWCAVVDVVTSGGASATLSFDWRVFSSFARTLSPHFAVFFSIAEPIADDESGDVVDCCIAAAGVVVAFVVALDDVAAFCSCCSPDNDSDSVDADGDVDAACDDALVVDVASICCDSLLFRLRNLFSNDDAPLALASSLLLSALVVALGAVREFGVVVDVVVVVDVDAVVVVVAAAAAASSCVASSALAAVRALSLSAALALRLPPKPNHGFLTSALPFCIALRILLSPSAATAAVVEAALLLVAALVAAPLFDDGIDSDDDEFSLVTPGVAGVSVDGVDGIDDVEAAAVDVDDDDCDSVALVDTSAVVAFAVDAAAGTVVADEVVDVDALEDDDDVVVVSSSDSLSIAS